MTSHRMKIHPDEMSLICYNCSTITLSWSFSILSPTFTGKGQNLGRADDSSWSVLQPVRALTLLTLHSWILVYIRTIQSRPEWVSIPESLEQLTQDLPLCHRHCCKEEQVKEFYIAYRGYNLRKCSMAQVRTHAGPPNSSPSTHANHNTNINLNITIKCQFWRHAHPP